MAASLSRPDPSSPASVAEAGFTTARKGYAPDEVRAFLVAVAAELGRLHERERELETELREARAAAGPVELDEATITELLGEETVRVLQTARESASQIKVRAEESAARILREANEHANRLRQETEVDAARRRQDANAEAEAEVALAKQQGREMVNEARAYRERVLADLDRRTTLARKQIEELLHGRDRLLQVFERARLVAVDVTAELRAVDAPEELVNLAPTTGPVPIMVKQERRPEAAPTDEREPAAPVAARPEPPRPDVADEPIRAEVPDEAADDETSMVAARSHEPDVDADVDDAVEHPADGVAADADDDDDDASDVDENVDVVVEADDAGDAGDAPSRDDNVVSLFRGRPVPVDDDHDDADQVDDDDPVVDGSDTTVDEAVTMDDETDHETDDETDDETDHETVDESDDETDHETDDETDDGRPDDVGGIFARLRDELPAESVAATAEHDDEVDGAADVEPEEETPFSRRDEAIVPLIVSGARKIKRVLADEQNGVLDRLRQKESVDALADLVPELDDHVAAYANAITEELAAAAAAGAGELGVRDSASLRGRLTKAGALDDARALVRSALIAPLRERLARSIFDGRGDHDDITRRVRAVYREWKTQHIDAQLDDVFRYAHGGGLIVSAEPGTPMIWTVDPRQAGCPDCEDNSLSGAVPCGQPFPTGHTAAPAHPGCRCLVVPVG